MNKSPPLQFSRGGGKNMTHGSLFSGIGGFELGAKRAGIPTLWSCEIEKYPRSILKKHFPKVKQYEDIKELRKPGYVDIISGGFPCQDISLSGKGAGITGSRSGLWNEMYRIIREVRPRYVVIENSPALLIRGFERVLCDLSEIGYSAEWKCLSNFEFGFDHLRERIYIIAYTDKKYVQTRLLQKRGKIKTVFIPSSNDDRKSTLTKRIYQMPDCEDIGVDDGVRDWVHRVGALGNAVNPCVARYLFECIKIFDEYISA